MNPDLMIRGGLVFDGTGAAPARTDVAVRAGRIVDVGDVEAEAPMELDAGGLAVAPGFIDVHSHSDYTLLVDPRAVSAIHQGVTTEVIGNCGHGCFPIRDPELSSRIIYGFDGSLPLDWSSPAAYLERLEEVEPAVNVLTLVPNGQLRLATLGLEARPATSAEVTAMTRLLEEGLEAGAWGYSTGLEYAPEQGAGEAEITALARVTARRGGFYATHTREREDRADEAVAEAIRTARNAGIRLQVSHLAPRSGLDQTNRCIDLVDAARAAGDDVAFDMHTRLYGLTFLYAMLPPRVLNASPREQVRLLETPEVRAQIGDHKSIITGLGDWGRIYLVDDEVWPDMARLDFEEIARRRDTTALDAACDLLLDSAGAGKAPMVLLRAYEEDQQEEVFAHDLCVPASDATALAPDGPLAGASFMGAYTWASWFWRFMVRETGRLKPQEAIHRLSGQPAEIVGLSDRGLLKPGMRADVVVFDPETFADTGTTFQPNRIATGMRHVVVNGTVTLRDGALTGKRAGAVLRKRA
ncbi:amidohydrolase family protein [Candidatus Palauibacter soopunensis]|uniref:N-acyl-D-amino-acid deacylase family protein n=1 Tax=Candidatus Palauibacter soopunensis TaxID=3056739 RepID=UPI002382FB56|nr:amidohydrolase family protein [Candidatus Palauibacter soopunensis]MDE2877371.1 amidohydrolase family protein [Candidatus Palauibacter soopunensis]